MAKKKSSKSNKNFAKVAMSPEVIAAGLTAAAAALLSATSCVGGWNAPTVRCQISSRRRRYRDGDRYR